MRPSLTNASRRDFHRTARRRAARAAVAVVGAGAAGIATAYYLTRLGISVELFEAGPRLGGNCLRVAVPTPRGGEVMLDMGVSDFNRQTFRRFDGFLDAMGVEVRPICEDAAALYTDGTTAWTSVGGRFSLAEGPAASSALVDEIRRFVTTAPKLLDRAGDAQLGDYLDRAGYSEAFKTLYARPRAGGCIVMPSRDPNGHDMRTLLRFWRLHGLVGRQPRERMHVVGGMWSYCDAFARWFRARGGRIRLGTRVRGITRGPHGARIDFDGAGQRGVCRADHVVVAVDASRVRGLIVDPDVDEQRAFDSVCYEHARVVVHRDRRLMPRDRSDWGAYQFYVERPGERLAGPSITFYPHRLAGLSEAEGVFVTVNPPIAPHPELVLAERDLVHPVANPAASRPDLFDRVQGRRNTWYAGAYLECPWLHEQAFGSGEQAAEGISSTARTLTARWDQSLSA